ncbi:MAG: DUF420 domain-containing protein [Acidobacteria bacterium]|nr:MAG: DUF420 domain-containing protein [Acidobacteriota bacterium]REK01356.1 MAG: DUF420 domain-containing protein [Acidobacteriota bacterium]REK14312.1 MAG: DUF420 domain-containing protein [Acidobacteriota bacterium]REK45027.1 MAG: DUF420 domain-containing protein [Acidobacteriota bacterium]
MDTWWFFPHLNAFLNGLSGVFLVAGFYFIKSGEREKHKVCMITALTVSAVFLTSYVTSKVVIGLDSVNFTAEGPIRWIYFFVLITHTVLAALITPFVLLTFWRAVKGRFEIHKKLARIVFPVWLYVSVTGVIVYLLLYQLFPPD